MTQNTLPDLYNISVEELPEDIKEKLYDMLFDNEYNNYEEFDDLIKKELDEYLYSFTSALYLEGNQLTFKSEAHYTFFLLKWM